MGASETLLIPPAIGAQFPRACTARRPAQSRATQLLATKSAALLAKCCDTSRRTCHAFLHQAQKCRGVVREFAQLRYLNRAVRERRITLLSRRNQIGITPRHGLPRRLSLFRLKRAAP